MPGLSAPTDAEEKEFQAKSDLRTLVEAEEIRNDKSRLKSAVAMAKKQMKALENVSDA